MRLNALLCLPLLAATTPVWGQARVGECGPFDVARGEETILACPLIVVTGNLPSAAVENTESIIQVPIEQARFEKSLTQVPGLQQFRRSDARSANPTSQGITLRGLGGNASSRAILVLDDVPQADPFGGWISLPSYDALNLASIRVRRGAGQVASGPGALAGGHRTR